MKVRDFLAKAVDTGAGLCSPTRVLSHSIALELGEISPPLYIFDENMTILSNKDL